MLLIRKNGATSNVFRVKLRRSDTGQGLTGLTSSSAGLIISTIADNEASATNYTQAGSTIQTITTLGTFATPSASNCRFKEVDATNQPGVYEFQLADTRFAVSSAKYLKLAILGAATLLEKEINIQLTGMDVDDAVHGGMSALPNTACTSNASIITSGTGTDQLSLTSGRIDIGKALGTAVTLDANNVLNVSTKYVGGTPQTARDIGASVLLSAGTGAGQLDFTSGVVKANATQWLGGTIPAVNVTGVPLVDLKYTLGTISPAAAGFMAPDWGHVNAPTTAVALTGTTVGTVTTYTGDTPQTGDTYTRIGAAGAGLTALGDTRIAHLDADVSSRLAPAGTLANVTNLTNAPTAGDLTATMKTSIGTTVAASAVASVTGDVHGKVLGSGASVLVGVGIQADVYNFMGSAWPHSASNIPVVGVMGWSPCGTDPPNSSDLTLIPNDGTGTTTQDGTPGFLITATGVWASGTTFVANVLNAGKPEVSVASVVTGAITSAAFTVATITGVASGFLEQCVQVWRYLFKKKVNDITNNQIRTYGDNGTTVLTTQTTSADATQQTVGPAS